MSTTPSGRGGGRGNRGRDRGRGDKKALPERGRKQGERDENLRKSYWASEEKVAVPDFYLLGLRDTKSKSLRTPSQGSGAATGSRSRAQSSQGKSPASGKNSGKASRADTPKITEESITAKVTVPLTLRAKSKSTLSPKAKEFVPRQSKAPSHDPGPGQTPVYAGCKDVHVQLFDSSGAPMDISADLVRIYYNDVYMTNIPPNVGSKEALDLFRRFGHIQYYVFWRGGIGLTITFTTVDKAEEAISNFNNVVFGGATLMVTHVPLLDATITLWTNETVIFVFIGDIPQSFKERDVKNAIQRWNPSEVQLRGDINRNAGKQEAQVRFDSWEDAEDASQYLLSKGLANMTVRISHPYRFG